MTTRISIEILHGSSSVQASDINRAENAALAVIAAAGTTPQAASDEFWLQWRQSDGRGPLTGLARVWIDAESAADLALTDGWLNPDGASCTIAA